jgi:hypothetical protein
MKSTMYKSIIINNKKLLVLLAYLVIAFSGIHFFVGHAIAKISFIVFLVIVARFKYFNSSTLIVLFLIFTLVILGQYATLGGFNIEDSLAVLTVSVLIPFFVFKIFGHSFPVFYVKAMYVLCLLSLPFYIGSLVSASFFHQLQAIPLLFPALDPSTYKYQFIIHSAAVATDSFSGLLRNAGPFHEAGVHALFLLIGFYFNFITTQKLFNKQGIVFILSLIFTFSTAGYLGIFLLFIGFSFVIKINPLVKLFFSVLLVIFSVNFFLTNELMYSKIKNEFEIAQERDMNDFTGGRFYGARKALNVLENYPLFGRGLTHATRETDEYSSEFLRYGIMSEFGKIGIPLAILYLVFLFKGLLEYEKRYQSSRVVTLFFFIALLVNLFSQSFALYPVLMVIVISGVSSNFLIKSSKEIKTNYYD